MRFKNYSLFLTPLIIIFAVGYCMQSARAQDKMVYAAKATSKFANFPGLPKCLMGAVQSGDPSTGASVILAKAATGCVIPWHWHTASEQLMIVSGSAKLAMKEGKPITAHSGDYASMPAKQAHQFTCVAACTFFILPSGAFDIHYVDKDGKEISPDEALKSQMKAPMKKEMKKDMKM